ncbi:o-succinylbenzoate--CoA ligase [Oceanobacillus alkalisoli]|uniref:o-succinylbenzoate--CoA ligase n=1 Tax=Oceanobacillus alkalisoli TaxID=2925113 RepID=UPI001EF05FDE|nr:o-succinylbenzoate--CoA ligase [Oceanobacillus alkalisoli]MCF3943486.1 o-succinylbenzoate--CoA ligase [Oceanobacillus alkalisoli]MCG5104074.1 o-succinylbenzoate--CoA ligase [Oceanobacillus alkalisoli]
MSEIIPHWLSKRANLSPENTALELVDGSNITFLELHKKSVQMANKIAALGVAKGTHLGILSANNLNMVYILHAVSYLGAVGVLLNTRLSDDEINYQLQDAEVSILITDEENSNRQLQVNESYSYDEVNKQTEVQTVLQKELNLAQPFTIIYTSGTTGFPKGVVHTYGNHWWSAISSALNLGLEKNDKWLISLPLFHVSGLSTLMKSVMYGMPIYLMKKFDVDLVHDAIMRKEVTIVSVVTLMMQRLMEKLNSESYPRTLRCFLLGGGPAPKILLEKAKDKNIPVFQSYGMTETTSQIATLSAQDALDKIGSAGKPLLPAELEIKNPGIDGVGEIIVKGPMVTEGYYKNEAANEQTLVNGWLHTGDLGYLDDAGYLYVVDRRTDLIISGGENIYPSEIENALVKLPEIEEAGVIGVADETWGEVPVAYVVLNEPVSETDILLNLGKQLAKYKLPKEIIFIKEMPRNASNKLVRNKLKDIT